MAKIYYVGDWAVSCGPVFAETPFNYAFKGLDLYRYGQWLKDSLESSGQHEVADVSAWEFYNLAPGAYEQILATYDVVIFSDVEAKNFQLNPHFFDRSKFGTRVLTFPDRVRLTVEGVLAGKRVMFLGGWLSLHAAAFDGVDLTSFPPILGYNKVLPREGCGVLLTVKETGDPLLAVGAFGEGKTLAYMSDPAPHWGCNFVYWEHYGAFWLKCLEAIL